MLDLLQSSEQGTSGCLKGKKITIITVVYNGAKYLEQAIESVLGQDYPNIEYLIIDGGSKDGSVDIIRKYAPQITSWVSEPDQGIYDAMNKGIRMASGDLIGVLNSDDLLHENVISKIAHAADQYPGYDYYYGSVSRMRENGEVYSEAKPVAEEELDERKYKQIPYPHGGLYMRKKVFEKIGLYNLDYTINSDYDLILRMLERNMKGFPLGFAVSRYRDGGVSGGYATFLERLKLLENHGVSRVQRSFTVATSITKLFLSGLLNRAGISYRRREPVRREGGAETERLHG